MSVTVCLSPKSTVSLRIGARDGPVLSAQNSPPQIDFLSTTKEGFRALGPSCVLGWLFHEKHDAFQIARWLVKINFEGVFYGVCNPLPRKHVVKCDMRRAFPELRFDLMILSESQINNNPYEASLRFKNKPPKKIGQRTYNPLQPA